jgi:hypothetical protein
MQLGIGRLASMKSTYGLLSGGDQPFGLYHFVRDTGAGRARVNQGAVCVRLHGGYRT